LRRRRAGQRFEGRINEVDTNDSRCMACRRCVDSLTHHLPNHRRTKISPPTGGSGRCRFRRASTRLPIRCGESCMIGQQGSDWFLAGTFGASTATRNCTIPAKVSLFFQVANLVAFDTPDACGQDSTPIPSAVYRDQTASFIEGFAELSVSLDSQPIEGIRAFDRTSSHSSARATPKDPRLATWRSVSSSRTRGAAIHCPILPSSITARRRGRCTGNFRSRHVRAGHCAKRLAHLKERPAGSK